MADTRRSERRALKAWEFDSPLGHSNRQEARDDRPEVERRRVWSANPLVSGLSPLTCSRRRWASAQPSLISLDCRVRLPDLQLGA